MVLSVLALGMTAVMVWATSSTGDYWPAATGAVSGVLFAGLWLTLVGDGGAASFMESPRWVGAGALVAALIGGVWGVTGGYLELVIGLLP